MSGKSHARTGIGGPSKQRRVVLRRRNTVVGGKKCALPSALLVRYVRDGRTDGQTKQTLLPPSYGRGHNKARSK